MMRDFEDSSTKIALWFSTLLKPGEEVSKNFGILAKEAVQVDG